MIEFKPPTLADREWIVSLLCEEEIALCSYSFTAFFCWSHVYHHEVCRFEDRLLVRAQTGVGVAYLYPVGKGDPIPALKAMEQDAKNRGDILRFISVPDEKRAVLKELFGRRMKIVYNRDYYDYLYDINKLADLKGKKLHAKRNHINRFNDQCPSWSFHPLTADDVKDCVALDKRWYDDHIEKAETQDEIDSLNQERKAMLLALTYFEDMGIDGGLIRCREGNVVAFTLGSRLTKTVYDVHFERANTEIQGTFPIINREFVRHIREKYPEVELIDREEDLGQEGLRKSKLSYLPDTIAENFYAVIEPEEMEEL